MYQTALNANLTGVCFSGGGIRSATFNLGVLQAIAAEDKLGSIDYLSTVSGGGYIHLFLASWIHRERLTHVQKIGELDAVIGEHGVDAIWSP